MNQAKNHPASAGRIRKKINKHTDAYIESVGRKDINTLADVASAENGKGTVLRLILGATALMPMRALTYVDSALRCLDVMPAEQLQIVHANSLGCRVNNISEKRVNTQTQLFGQVVNRHVETYFAHHEDKVLHATDMPLALGKLGKLATKALEENPELYRSLKKKGDQRGGDPAVYTAAHFAFQDTDMLRLAPLNDSSPDQIEPARMVSIGCLKERDFYAARMAMRELDREHIKLPTAQIFTKHTLPPYFMARGGEQTLEDFYKNGLDISQADDIQARRDIDHFINITTKGKTNE